ncbi:major facilitator superfamily domain-containing protein [Tribonema minus]|uniref:Major facilitator superfamily domain-containing protein n=1 Tax=Tribonema minus TaxID=303371 RepID=A0A835YXC6_9STRA|nr:major facilitator superfamily domain-containing protein [Tribonema minus]
MSLKRRRSSRAAKESSMMVPQGVVLAGLANLAISFNIVNISLSVEVMRHLYKEVGTEVSLCASALLVGMILGQVVFGAMGDCLGRERALIYALQVCMVAALGSALLTSPAPVLGLDIYAQLTAWRFLLGTGAGGVYPLMAVIAKESATSTSTSTRAPGAMTPSTAMATVFSLQGWGYLLSPLTMLVLLRVPRTLDAAGEPTAALWRAHLGLGALPLAAVVALAYRQVGYVWVSVLASGSGVEQQQQQRQRRSSSSFGTASRSNSDAGASEQGQQTSSAAAHGGGGFWKLWHFLRNEPGLARLLAGTALPWLLFDVMFYGNNLFVPRVLEAVMGPATASTSPLIRAQSLDDLLLKAVALPGYIVAIVVIDHTGPKALQLLGFSAMAAAYAAIGLAFDTLPRHPRAALALYAATFLFANVGPNSTTFVLPSTLFREEVRASLSGVSGAAGKLGAILGSLAFDPLAERWGVAVILLICGGISLVALAVTAALVPGGGGGGSSGSGGGGGALSIAEQLAAALHAREALRPNQRAISLPRLRRLASALLPQGRYARVEQQEQGAPGAAVGEEGEKGGVRMLRQSSAPSELV